MEHPIARIRRWVLEHAQLSGGPQAGAVLGGRCPDRDREYVYPEITGYFLSWLAFADACDPVGAQETGPRRQAAISWLLRETRRPGGPRTRGRVGSATDPTDDWRNRALFAFDLGMAYRGIRAAAPAADAAPRELRELRELRDRLTRLLDSLRQPDGSWLSCLPRGLGAGARAPLPERWSTRPGPHLLKAAGGVLALAPPSEDRSAVRAAEATLSRHAPELVRNLPDMSHPALYALEGLLQAELAGHTAHHDDLLAGYRQLTRHTADGVLHEVSASPTSRVRSDVLAQLVRVGCVLYGNGALDEEERGRLDMLAAALTGHVDSDGGVRFDLADASHHNVWCALFAHQALVFHRHVGAGLPVPGDWVRLLV